MDQLDKLKGKDKEDGGVVDGRKREEGCHVEKETREMTGRPHEGAAHDAKDLCLNMNEQNLEMEGLIGEEEQDHVALGINLAQEEYWENYLKAAMEDYVVRLVTQEERRKEAPVDEANEICQEKSILRKGEDLMNTSKVVCNRLVDDCNEKSGGIYEEGKEKKLEIEERAEGERLDEVKEFFCIEKDSCREIPAQSQQMEDMHTMECNPIAEDSDETCGLLYEEGLMKPSGTEAEMDSTRPAKVCRGAHRGSQEESKGGQAQIRGSDEEGGSEEEGEFCYKENVSLNDEPDQRKQMEDNLSMNPDWNIEMLRQEDGTYLLTEEDFRKMAAQTIEESINRLLEECYNKAFDVGEPKENKGEVCAGTWSAIIKEADPQEDGRSPNPASKENEKATNTPLLRENSLTDVNIMDMICLGFDVKSQDEESIQEEVEVGCPPHIKTRRKSWGEVSKATTSTGNKGKRGRKRKTEMVKINLGSPRKTRGRAKKSMDPEESIWE